MATTDLDSKATQHATADNELLARVHKKLGVESVSTDLEGLRALYHAWCAGIPFDNIRKSIFTFANPGAEIPFVDTEEFFDAWLRHGTGATCWPHSKAIHALCKSCGFDARLAAGSMFDMGPANHATVIVHLDDGSRWILDNAFLNMEPIRIDPEAPSCFATPVHYAEVELDGDNVFIYGTHPPMAGIYFRLLLAEVDEAFYSQQWNELASTGPFNSCLHIRKNIGYDVVVIRGDTLFHLSSSGLNTEKLDADGIRDHLRETMDISEEMIEKWSASGALDASVGYKGAAPPPPSRFAPSKRV